MDNEEKCDTTDVQNDKEAITDEPNTTMKVDLSDIVLPSSSPPTHSNNGSEIKSEHSSPYRDYPQKRRNSPPLEPVSKKLRENIVYEVNDDSSSDAEELCIILKDVPNDFMLRNYMEECDVEGDVLITKNENQEVKLKFENEDDYHRVEKMLTSEREKGSKINFKIPGREADLEDNMSDKTEIAQQSSPWKPNEDIEDIDPLGLYGLRIEYLRSLEITPPLDRWIHVTNFRCDKFELRDIMELAGRVLSCSVMNISKRYAKVQYSHPLEAVQAVAMLNGQMYFGLKLSVCLERNPRNDIILPKGLVNIGLGLGLLGKPIRDIACQYERYIRKQSSTINPALFRKLDPYDSRVKDEMQSVDEGQIEFKEFMNSTNRCFEVKHVEDLDSADGVQSERDYVKESNSPESISLKSMDSPVSCHEVKDLEKTNDCNKSLNTSEPGIRTVPEAPGSVIPTRLRQASPAVGFPRPIVAQNLRPQTLYSTSFRPNSSVPQVIMSNNQYSSSFQPPGNAMPEVRPNPVPHPMVNPIGNPPHPGPFGLSQPFTVQAPTGPVPIALPNNPGPVYGLTSMYTPGAVPGPPIGIGQRPGPIHGPRPMTGPRPIIGPGPVLAPGPVRGPGPVLAPGPVRGPGPVLASGPIRGPGPIQGSGPVQGTGPVQAPGPPTGVNHGPGPGSVTATNLITSSGNKVNVEFANLPPSTTFPFLCEKLSQCGQVLSLRFTTPGCAAATFSHPSHAERCFQNYNGMTVEGFRIVVKLV